LDTHALVWYTHGDSKLTATAQAAIQNGANDIWISPASYWEIAIKVHLGGWQLNQPYHNFMDIVLYQYGFEVLPIRPEHTARLIGMPNHHRDPFDRLLIAQALVEGLTLVSSDVAFDQYGVTRVW
jgi:PIN domain nuclease of toxin-antitoxin system